ncbi:MAG: hypothetical protein ACQ9MH_17360 [Nitrospinales bacterium]
MFLENTHIVHACPLSICAAFEDVFGGDIASDVINMENAKTAVFIITLGGGTGSATVQIVAADDATPNNTTAISFNYKQITAPDTQGATTEAKSVVVGGASDTIFVIETSAAKLAEAGYGYIQLEAAEKVAFPRDGSVMAFLMGMRSAEDVTPTQVV